MNCKSCNTRIHGSETACPNCGRKPVPGRRAPKPSPEKDQANKVLGAHGDSTLELEQVINPPGSERPLSPKPAELRGLLAACPELLEPGLRLAMEPTDSVSRQTDVGEIDLLLVDEQDSLLVVMIPESPDMAKALCEILPRMGWMSRHAAKTYPSVRGIVLLCRAPSEIDYAAAAVADSVSFRTYRMALCFDSVET